ncbi:unnamed protein product [Ectocarpus sp. CCAP 1310/34]|nr:unnamed protein product [Ectocarpus sp. CCAP 1310/34]
MSLHLGDKLAHLCPNKDFVFLRASMVPQIPEGSRAFTRNTWEALTRRAYQMHITGSPAELDLDWRKKAFYGAGRGPEPVGRVPPDVSRDPSGRKRSNATATATARMLQESWIVRGLVPDAVDGMPVPASTPRPRASHLASLKLPGAVLGVLETAVGRSRDMFSAGAYVHQYAQFGAERGDFEEAFLGVEQAVENYRSLG